MNEIKLVVVGDGSVGKTSLLLTYVKSEFPEDYVPTVCDNCSKDVSYEDRTVTLNLHDTAGQEDYDRLRPLSYPDTNIFIIAYSIHDPTSLENVKTKWLPEVEEHCPGIPILLVGTKLDLREARTDVCLEERDEKPVTFGEGERMAENLKLDGYCECSAISMKGIQEVFEKAVQVAHTPNAKRKKGGGGSRGNNSCSFL